MIKNHWEKKNGKKKIKNLIKCLNRERVVDMITIVALIAVFGSAFIDPKSKSEKCAISIKSRTH